MKEGTDVRDLIVVGKEIKPICSFDMYVEEPKQWKIAGMIKIGDEYLKDIDALRKQMTVIILNQTIKRNKRLRHKRR